MDMRLKKNMNRSSSESVWYDFTVVAFISFTRLYSTCRLICHELSRSPAAVGGTPNGATFVSAQRIWILTAPRLRNWKPCIPANMHALRTKAVVETSWTIRPGACLRDLRDVGSHSRNFLQPKLLDVLSTVNVFAVVWMNQRYRECKHMQTGCQIAKHNHLSPSLSRHFPPNQAFQGQLDLRLTSFYIDFTGSNPLVVNLSSTYLKIAFGSSFTGVLWESFPTISRYYSSN